VKKLLLLSFLLVLTACKSKGEACATVMEKLEPIAKELDAIAAASEAAPPPSPADPASCTRLADEVRRVEDALARLSLLVTKDEMLAKHLEVYRLRVGIWAKATKKAQLSCLLKDGNAMTGALSEALQYRAQLAPVKSDITSYCKAP
jgi:hypothetical protein